MNHPRGLFPFDPVQRALAHRFERISDPGRYGAYIEAGDDTRASELLAVSRKTLCRWRAGQLLSIEYADHCAIRLGLHPVDLWPNWHEIIDAAERDRDARVAADRRRRNASRYRQAVA